MRRTVHISFSSLNEEERSFIEGHHEERKKVILHQEESDSEGETDNEELETEPITDSGFILDAENTIL